MKKTSILMAVFLLMIVCDNVKAQTTDENAKPVATEQVEYKTDSVEVNGLHFTYRKIGTNKITTVPLVMFTHTRGNLDSWDPAFTDELAKERTVIIFNNKGVATSEGKTPDSFAAMAEDGYQFIKALGYEKVDILGFSIGGCVAQELLASRGDVVRNAVLAGTSPKGAKSINQRDPAIAEMVTRPTLGEEEFLALFFNTSEKSRELGRAFWKRRAANKYPKDIAVSKESAKAQAVARLNWGDDTSNSIDYKKISHPILVANGKVDIQMPTHNSVDLYHLLPNAKLILYPDSGHGFLFQYPETFGDDVNKFLNQNH